MFSGVGMGHVVWKSGHRASARTNASKPIFNPKTPNVGNSKLTYSSSLFEDDQQIIDAARDHFYVGSLWVANEDYRIATVYNYATHKVTRADGELPLLVISHDPPLTVVSRTTFGIYAGDVRIDTRARGSTVRIKRPTFIFNSCRYVISTVRGISPVK